MPSVLSQLQDSELADQINPFGLLRSKLINFYLFKPLCPWHVFLEQGKVIHIWRRDAHLLKLIYWPRKFHCLNRRYSMIMSP